MFDPHLSTFDPLRPRPRGHRIKPRTTSCTFTAIIVPLTQYTLYRTVLYCSHDTVTIMQANMPEGIMGSKHIILFNTHRLRFFDAAAGAAAFLFPWEGAGGAAAAFLFPLGAFSAAAGASS